MTMKNAINSSRLQLLTAIVLMIAAIISGTICRADNPIVQTVYTADPAPMVYKDTLYVYTGHDEGGKFFTMNDWRVFSTKDMVNWTDHGSPLSWKTFKWARGDAWAGQCIERDGKFYYYVPMNKKGGGMVIGVAVADSPTGPFKDPLGHPLVESGPGDIDPTAFIDDDGQAYLYWGNPYLKYVKLNKDMISFDKTVGVVNIPLTEDSFGKRTGNKDRATLYEEGPWSYKRNGMYYMVYAASGIPENIAYSTSTSPTGPWKYKGIIMPTQGASFTNHAGLIEYKGKSYFFYHNGALPGGGGFTRSVCVEEFAYNHDGSFPTINMTKEGPKAIAHLDPYQTTQAETMAWESGIKTKTSDTTGVYVTDIHNGDYIKVKGVDFGNTKTASFTANVASGSKGGTIELHLDGVDGALIGSVAVPNTGSEKDWKSVTANVSGATGLHDLYLVFKGDGPDNLFNFDWWKVDKKSKTSNPIFSDSFTADPAAMVVGDTVQTKEGISRVAEAAKQSVQLFPLKNVRLLESPFSEAVKANRQYLLAHNADRFLAPFRREAGLTPKAQPYGNWESMGLEGHSAGHYLSALSLMIASGADPDGEFRRRLDYMIDELAEVQKANGNGYIGGVQGSKEFWKSIADGHVELIGKKWVPWYNLHKMFAGLRDAYINAGNEKARDLLINFGDWCEKTTAGLTDKQMQQMIGVEYGGMNEVLADIYVITGNEKYMNMAKRFNQRSLFEPLENRQDRLTGIHANTQIPKIVGMERIAALTHDDKLHTGAEFFWETVTRNRCVAFGGNSVSEHFNSPKDFSGMIEHRDGPETCNTYNMLKLTEELFTAEPKAAYADFYERALYNHILASINPKRPGYVYFTSIRPAHYRVYSQPEQAFWCCVGTGMENPGKYGEFIYARSKDGLYVNLFIPSELSVPDNQMVLKQETKFPDEASTQLVLQLKKPTTFTLNIRHPEWVSTGDFAVKVNGKSVAVESTPSSYAAIRREWNNGDQIEVSLPMRTTVERLPDGSDWIAIKHGPIVLASSSGTKDIPNLYADGSRMGHAAFGPTVPMDQIPVLLSTAEGIVSHIVEDPKAGPLHFRLADVVEPAAPKGVLLEPFFRLHDQRYQMYWQLTTKEKIAERRERLAAVERAKAAREAATIDSIAVGEQQPEVEHDLKGEGMDSGIHNGRRWRHGAWIQYTLDPRGAKETILAVTYSGDDGGREFDILVNGQVIATQKLTREKPNNFIEKRYPIPSDILKTVGNGRLTVKFAAKHGLAGGLYDVRLLKFGTPEVLPLN